MFFCRAILITLCLQNWVQAQNLPVELQGIWKTVETRVESISHAGEIREHVSESETRAYCILKRELIDIFDANHIAIYLADDRRTKVRNYAESERCIYMFLNSSNKTVKRFRARIERVGDKSLEIHFHSSREDGSSNNVSYRLERYHAQEYEKVMREFKNHGIRQEPDGNWVDTIEDPTARAHRSSRKPQKQFRVNPNIEPIRFRVFEFKNPG